MRNRRLISLFFLIAIPIAIALPAVNVAQGNAHLSLRKVVQGEPYSLDRVRPLASRAASSLGISLNPGSAIVGHDGWLYLGDDYASIISRRRFPLSAQEATLAGADISKFVTSWTKWLSENGSSEFAFAIFPDKETIQGSHLPTWAQGPGLASQVLPYVPQSLIVNTEADLLEAQANTAHTIFFKTDTHWNASGAWAGYSSLRKFLSKSSSIKFLSDDAVSKGPKINWAGGDLAQLIYARGFMHDNDFPVRLIEKIDVSVSEYDTGKTISTEGNLELGAPSVATLVKSPRALNQLRVLWFRDSFGSAISPYMAATFSDVIQLHYEYATPEKIKALVETFEPDLVLVTTVERALLSNAFRSSPE